MPSARVVEALDVVEHIGAGFISGAIDLAAVRSVFSDEKKLSIAELSQTLPARLIEQVMPLSASRRWNCSLVYCAALVRVMQQASGLASPPDGHHQGIGDQRGVISAFIDQPTTLRENRSRTTAT
jgi:hypothetical protein